jgi:hypothetical protein
VLGSIPPLPAPPPPPPAVFLFFLCSTSGPFKGHSLQCMPFFIIFFSLLSFIIITIIFILCCYKIKKQK